MKTWFGVGGWFLRKPAATARKPQLISFLVSWTEGVAFSDERRDGAARLVILRRREDQGRVENISGSRARHAQAVVTKREMSRLLPDSSPRPSRSLKSCHGACVLPVSLEPGKTYALWLNHVGPLTE